MPRHNTPFKTVSVNDRLAWRDWLQQYHATSHGVHLIVLKKHSTKLGLSYVDAVEEALCFGWIDSRTNALDDNHFLLVMTPRKPKSIWAANNKQRVEKLIRQGLMTSEGLEKIEAAKRDGSWYIIDAIDALRIPDDLQQALNDDATAKKHFATFSDSSKKMILYWILSAKRPETRLKRIRLTVTSAAQNMKPTQYQQDTQ